jgi:hypothetical protein
VGLWHLIQAHLKGKLEEAHGYFLEHRGAPGICSPVANPGSPKPPGLTHLPIWGALPPCWRQVPQPGPTPHRPPSFLISAPSEPALPVASGDNFSSATSKLLPCVLSHWGSFQTQPSYRTPSFPGRFQLPSSPGSSPQPHRNPSIPPLPCRAPSEPLASPGAPDLYMRAFGKQRLRMELMVESCFCFFLAERL